MANAKQQGAAVQTASADKTMTPRVDYDEMAEAVTSVKACAAALMAMYLQDAGRLTYDVELFETLAHLLHGAARYFDGVLETL